METITRPPIPRKQNGKALDHQNLQEVIDSSPDVLKKGTAQFFTPHDYARVFALPLSPVRPVIVDFHCGSHALSHGARAEHTQSLLGVDLDRRSQSKGVRTIIGDLNKVFPLMREGELKFDMVVMNPPFALRWPAPDVSMKHRRSSRSIDGVIQMDSIQASWLMALDRLSEFGEGMMIAPQPVVERLIMPCPTYAHVWMHVTLPQFFPGVRDDRKMAVLYFAKRHKNEGKPCMVSIPSPALQVVSKYLRVKQGQRSIWLGQTERLEKNTRHMRDMTTVDRFEMVRQEYLDRQKTNRPKFNIWLDSRGRIKTYLSSFDEVSRKISKTLVRHLHGLSNRRPIELVLTKSDRLALLHTVRDAGWKVERSLIDAVDSAVAEYHRSRTPFIKPTLAMRVAWAEEEDSLSAVDDWEEFKAGESYRLTSETFEGRKMEIRPHADYGEEDVMVSGQELMICINDSNGHVHGFTQYALDRDSIHANYDSNNDDDDETRRTLLTIHKFHSLRDLMVHFKMPEVKDIAEVNPELYQHYRNKLKALETA